MEKLSVTSYIKDDDLRNKMYRIVDSCNYVLKNYELKQTEFLNPFEIKNAIAIINSDSDLKYRVDGGLEDAESSVIAIFPYYMEVEKEEMELAFLQIDGNFKFSSVSHKDYLGSILSLGIKREKIGDILVHEDFCQIVVSKDIADYIIYNMDRVKNNRVELRYIERKDLQKVEHQFDEKVVSVSSLRLDNVIAGAYNISRQEATKAIQGEYVKVDYERISQTSKTVEEGSLISVRRQGRFILDEVGSISKKGKLRIKIKKFK